MATKTITKKRTTPRLKGWAGRVQTGCEAQGLTIIRTGRDLFRVTRGRTFLCEGSIEKVHERGLMGGACATPVHPAGYSIPMYPI
jgi:hypothetical protein